MKAHIRTWQTLAEADALDAVMTLLIQYAGNDDLSVDSMGVRSVERVIDLVKAYGLITGDRICSARWDELRTYRHRNIPHGSEYPPQAEDDAT